MITRKELIDTLEEIDTKRITIKDYIQAEIIDVFEKRGLVEHEPTAMEQWKEEKGSWAIWFSGNENERIVAKRYVRQLINIADAAIKEADGKRQ